MLPRWKKLSSEVVIENPFWRYRKDQFELNGKQGEYHYASTHGSAMVIPVTPQGELVLVEQFRYLLDRVSIEFPGGGLEHAHEPPLEAAARELAEECGFAGDLALLGTFTPWNGVTDELCHVYLADPVRPDASGARPDATESFLLHRLTPAAFDAEIAAGRIWDGMTLAAYTLFRSRLPR
jgi:ADP-ribose pyrophosphatase